MLTQTTSKNCKNLVRKCYKLTEFSYQTKIKHVNVGHGENQNIHVNTNRDSKEKFGFDPYAILPLKGSDEFQDVRKQIFRSKDGRSIRHLLKSKLKTSAIKYDPSVFAAAITKCGEIGDTKNILKIMDIVYKKNIERDRNMYNILFRALALNEKSFEYLPFINNMINKDKIKPDIVTASILIGGCKYRGDIETAENIWNDMIVKFDLEPTEMTYIQILSVYAKAAEPDKAQKKFKEMIDKGIRPSQQTCGALMQCFANCMDIDNVIKIKMFMHSKGIKLDSYQYRSLITVYLKNRLPVKALEMYNQYIRSLNGDIPHKAIVGMKSHIFTVMLEDNVKKGIDDANTKHYYDMITKTCLDEIKQYYGNKSVVLDRLKYNQLKVQVLYHYDLKKNKQKTLKVFKDLCNEYQIGWWKKDDKTNQWVIDFHYFAYESAKFLLEYLFEYEKENILGMKDILILCGTGRHRDKYSSDNKHPDERGLMWFIQNELSQWSPMIRSQKCQDNWSMLRLFRQDVIAYFQANEGIQDSQLEVTIKEDTIYGDIHRKKLSKKYLDELRRNLVVGREIEIVTDADKWKKYKVKQHKDKADFIVNDIENDEELTLNFKSLRYRLR